MISGIEEALNKDRLLAAWSKVDNNLIPRGKERTKFIWMGTRWSLIDPAGIRMELLQNDETYKDVRYSIINLPALDENDKSNFDYDYGVGFSTDYYVRRRASFERNNDMASWFAQYMGEPIERDGALFTPEEMRYYNGVLPGGEPDRIYLACDPAWGGGDYVAAPVAYDYEDETYIVDVVFDLGDKYVTRPRIVDLILKHKVQAARFEANNGGEGYKEWVEQELKNRGYKLNITSRLAPTNKRKEQRIFDRAPISSFTDLDDITIEYEIEEGIKFFNLVREIVGDRVRIIVIKGNHETRWERYISKMHDKKLYKFINPNILHMLRDGMTIYSNNGVTRLMGDKDLIVIDDWFINYKGVIVCHPINYYKQVTKLAASAVDHFISRGGNFHTLVTGHNHHQSMCFHAGKWAIESGCACQEMTYMDGKTTATNQDYGVVFLKFKGKTVDVNKSKIIKL